MLQYNITEAYPNNAPGHGRVGQLVYIYIYIYIYIQLRDLIYARRFLARKNSIFKFFS